MAERQQHHDEGQTHGSPDTELTAILHQICDRDEAFGHRQHIHLAFIAVCRYGMPAAAERVCTWIKQIAAYEKVPQKYHETVSRAWVEIVAHHVAAKPDCESFEEFVLENPAVLDKRLLREHYSPSALSAPVARRAFADPDLSPFPWERRPPADPRARSATHGYRRY